MTDALAEAHAWTVELNAHRDALRKRIEPWPPLRCTQPAPGKTTPTAVAEPLRAGDRSVHLQGGVWAECGGCGRLFLWRDKPQTLCAGCRAKQREIASGLLHAVACKKCCHEYYAKPNVPPVVAECFLCSDGKH